MPFQSYDYINYLQNSFKIYLLFGKIYERSLLEAKITGIFQVI